MDTPRPSSVLLLLSGPAGSGKTTLCERIVAERPGVRRVVTCTTRPPRAGERDGADYHFLDDAAFDRALEAGEFLEWARVHTRRYGVLRREILGKLDRGDDLVMNVDVQGAATFRAAAAREPALARRLVTIFILPARLDDMRARLLARGKDGEDEIARRLRTAEGEIESWPSFDYCFTSGTREADYATLEAIYLAEKHRVARLRAAT